MPAYKQSHDVNKIYSHLEQAHKIIQEMKCAYDVRLGEREPQWLRANKPIISQYALFSAGKADLLCIFAPAVLKQLNYYTMILLYCQ